MVTASSSAVSAAASSRAGGARVVAVDLRGDSENAAACEALGVPVIPGDGTSPAALRVAGIDPARLLYRNPFFLRGPADGASGAPHLLVPGFGDLGQAVVAHGLRTALALRHRKPRVTVLETRGERTSGRFTQAHPGIETVADIAFDAVRLGPGESSAWGVVETACGERVTAAIVCVPDDSDGQFIASGLRDRLDRLGHVATPVFVAVVDRTRLGAFFQGLEGGGWLPHRLVPFGGRAELLGEAVLLEDALDRLARAQHQAYRAAGGVKGGNGRRCRRRSSARTASLPTISASSSGSRGCAPSRALPRGPST